MKVICYFNENNDLETIGFKIINFNKKDTEQYWNRPHSLYKKIKNDNDLSLYHIENLICMTLLIDNIVIVYNKQRFNCSITFLIGQDVALKIKEIGGNFLCEEVKCMILDCNDSYWDNLRWATVGNKDEELIYESKLKRGCCGFEDKIVTDPETKQQFKIGINYGH